MKQRINIINSWLLFHPKWNFQGYKSAVTWLQGVMWIVLRSPKVEVWLTTIQSIVMFSKVSDKYKTNKLPNWTNFLFFSSSLISWTLEKFWFWSWKYQADLDGFNSIRTIQNKHFVVAKWLQTYSALFVVCFNIEVAQAISFWPFTQTNKHVYICVTLEDIENHIFGLMA